MGVVVQHQKGCRVYYIWCPSDQVGQDERHIYLNHSQLPLVLRSINFLLEIQSVLVNLAFPLKRTLGLVHLLHLLVNNKAYPYVGNDENRNRYHKCFCYREDFEVDIFC